MNKYVTYVPAHLNTSKVPQARLIESFLGYLVQNFLREMWEATTKEELIRKKKDYGRCQGKSQIFGA
jgi:hypothetical protein